MNRTLFSCGRKACRLPVANTAAFSTAFDPYFALHSDSTKKLQQDSFRKLWEKNTGNFKGKMTGAEIEAIEEKIRATTTFDDFDKKMTGLFGPRRHHFVRETRTWLYTKDAVEAYLKTPGAHPRDLIFGEDAVFNAFHDEYLSDPQGYLKEFCYADLRYMCAAQAIDAYGAPRITAGFGCRKQYHYKFPSPTGGSAYWQSAVFDRVKSEYLVLLSCVAAIQEDKAVSPSYFADWLGGVTHCAYKEEQWRHLATQCSKMPLNKFPDQFDRAFNAFQTDKGVTQLTLRFDTDIDWEPNYLEKALYHPQYGPIDPYDKEADPHPEFGDYVPFKHGT